MGQKFYNEADVQAIASAIRGKNGTQNTYTVSQMAAAVGAIPTGVSNCVTATYTCTSAKGNQNITLVSGNSFIAANYNNAKAFALVVKVSGLQSNGLTLFFNTNQAFGVVSTSNTANVYGYFAYDDGTVAGTGYRTTMPLSEQSSNAGHMYATSGGDLVVRSGGITQAFQTGDYFILFGLMEAD